MPGKCLHALICCTLRFSSSSYVVMAYAANMLHYNKQRQRPFYCENSKYLWNVIVFQVKSQSRARKLNRKQYFVVSCRFWLVAAQWEMWKSNKSVHGVWIRTASVCSFRRIQKRIFDPMFARFGGRKEREIRNWICNLGNFRKCVQYQMAASEKTMWFLLFDGLMRWWRGRELRPGNKQNHNLTISGKDNEKVFQFAQREFLKSSSL